MTTKREPAIKKIEDTAEAWESGALGCDEAHVKPAPPMSEAEADAAAGMTMISLRLPQELIAGYKLIAQRNKGIKYQTLMRQVLLRFYEGEMKNIVREMRAQEAKRKKAA